MSPDRIIRTPHAMAIFRRSTITLVSISRYSGKPCAFIVIPREPDCGGLNRQARNPVGLPAARLGDEPVRVAQPPQAGWDASQ